MADAGLGPSVQRVQDALAAAGGGHTIVALAQSARTSADAGRAVGCRVDQIAKSLVFRAEKTQRAVLVITSGANRVDEVKVTALLDEPIGRADADFVRARTGFAIGGVAPIAHAEPLTILIDEDLLRWPEIWAAAGHPNAVFRLTPDDLVRMTGGRVASVRTGDGR
jgi:prolyl-tRNA editing enzyme YbaK/EbsC (Cys-tRNA(Pro) deacylase)